MNPADVLENTSYSPISIEIAKQGVFNGLIQDGKLRWYSERPPSQQLVTIHS